MSVTGTNTSSQRGLTLIELLIVLVIMALVSGVVIVTMARGPAPAQEVTDEVLAELQHLRTDAIVFAQPMGVRLAKQGVDVLAFAEGKWQIIDSILTDISQRDVTLSFQQGEGFILPEDDREAPRLILKDGAVQDEVILRPDIAFDPTGEATPSSLFVRGDDTIYQIVISAQGQFEVKLDD